MTVYDSASNDRAVAHGPDNAPLRYVTYDGDTWCSECKSDVWDVSGHDRWHDAGRPMAGRQRLGKVVDDGD